jgi:hypothetical protein
MEVWNIIFGVGGLVLGAAGVLVTIVLYKLSVARSPRIHFDGKGILCRCLTPEVFRKGWGIIPVNGTMTVSHKPVTVVNAELYYKMDKKHVRPSGKSMGKEFPPLHKFVRVANDQQGSIGALLRQGFTPVKLTPGEGEQPVSVRFALAGNFAEEYSEDFFSGALSTLQRMFIPMMIRFEYEHNGRFYWTKKFPILVYPYFNQGWTPDGPKWIDEDGRLIDVRHSQPVEQPPKWPNNLPPPQ